MKKELPAGWLNRKRYNIYIYGTWVVLFIGFALLILYNSYIETMKPLTVIIWSIIIVLANMLFKNSIINKERMEANKPMLELIRNIEGNEALKAVDELLGREDLSQAMQEKYLIEKVYTLMYLGREQEAKELLDTIERPKGGHNLYIYLELCFELAEDPNEFLKLEFEKLNDIKDIQAKATLQGVLEYRQAILEAEKTGNPSEDLRQLIFTQKDIFTMLMNQYRIIKIYRNKSRAIVREACEKCLEYGNDLLRFTNIANKVLEELGPISEEEKLEAEKIRELGAAFMENSDFENNDEVITQEQSDDSK